jgi:AcrR family transcriptional regulator
MSLRERKKQQTRAAIAAAAWRLFEERGFEAVTIAEIARAADVSEGTVFNYFPAKEDLFYSQMEAFEAELVAAVRAREPGESVLEAFRRVMLERGRGLGSAERSELIARAAGTIDASPALRARQREIVDQATRDLAAAIADETGARPDAVEPLVVAHALMGVQQTLQRRVWERISEGQRGPALAASVKREAKKAFATLEHGLGDYGRKPN